MMSTLRETNSRGQASKEAASRARPEAERAQAGKAPEARKELRATGKARGCAGSSSSTRPAGGETRASSRTTSMVRSGRPRRRRARKRNGPESARDSGANVRMTGAPTTAGWSAGVRRGLA